MVATPVFILPGLLEDADAFSHQVDALRAITACTAADLTQQETISALAADALRQAPERVERVAFLNTHARADSPEATDNRKRLMALAEKDFPAVIRALLPKLVTEEHLDTASGTITEMALATGRDAFLRQERAIIGRIDSRPHLARIRCPALVVAARQDQLMPVELLQELAAGIPGARLEIVENSGHMASIEQPEQVTRLLVDWLSNPERKTT